ncbi:MAG: hypothetical protein J0L94_07120 [Rhodothermia bacterium]|nr:hypothetical protein [Rhodothermia bacterium]
MIKFKITYFHLLLVLLTFVWPMIWPMIAGHKTGMDVAQFPWIVLIPLSMLLSKEIPDAWKGSMTGNYKYDLMIYILLFIILMVVNLKLASLI